jgi:hypothetical protein
MDFAAVSRSRKVWLLHIGPIAAAENIVSLAELAGIPFVYGFNQRNQAFWLQLMQELGVVTVVVLGDPPAWAVDALLRLGALSSFEGSIEISEGPSVLFVWFGLNGTTPSSAQEFASMMRLVETARAGKAMLALDSPFATLAARLLPTCGLPVGPFFAPAPLWDEKELDAWRCLAQRAASALPSCGAHVGCFGRDVAPAATLGADRQRRRSAAREMCVAHRAVLCPDGRAAVCPPATVNVDSPTSLDCDEPFAAWVVDSTPSILQRIHAAAFFVAATQAFDADVGFFLPQYPPASSSGPIVAAHELVVVRMREDEQGASRIVNISAAVRRSFVVDESLRDVHKFHFVSDMLSVGETHDGEAHESFSWMTMAEICQRLTCPHRRRRPSGAAQNDKPRRDVAKSKPLCADDDEALAEISSGGVRTCAEARPHCASLEHAEVLQRLCPVTCAALCVTPITRKPSASAAPSRALAAVTAVHRREAAESAKAQSSSDRVVESLIAEVDAVMDRDAPPHGPHGAASAGADALQATPAVAGRDGSFGILGHTGAASASTIHWLQYVLAFGILLCFLRHCRCFAPYWLRSSDALRHFAAACRLRQRPAEPRFLALVSTQRDSPSDSEWEGDPSSDSPTLRPLKARHANAPDLM